MDHKPEVNMEDLEDMNPCVIAMIGFVCAFAHTNKLPCVITSLKTDKVNGRVSPSHKQGRAADFSLRKWSKRKIHELVTKGNGEFYDIAAISNKTKMPTAFVDHDSGQGYHLHVQCKR